MFLLSWNLFLRKVCPKGHLATILSRAARSTGDHSTPRKAASPSFGAKLLLAALGILLGGGLVPSALVNTPPMWAQSPQMAGKPLPTFEVASVKRSRSSENSSSHFTPGRVIIRNLPVSFIIEIAYARDMGPYGFSLLRDNQLLGGPGWMRSGYDGYDIVAKVPDSLASQFGKDCGHAFFRGRCGYRKQIFLMLRSVLADRFKLKVKSETEEGPVFDLVTTKDGPKFLHTTFPLAGSSAEAQEESLPALHPLPCPAGLFCDQEHWSMTEFAVWLSRLGIVGRPVIDKTGLKGRFYTKLQIASGHTEDTGPNMGNSHPMEAAGPSIFTALKEQLGLRLKPAKGPVRKLLVEHIERPTPN